MLRFFYDNNKKLKLQEQRFRSLNLTQLCKSSQIIKTNMYRICVQRKYRAKYQFEVLLLDKWLMSGYVYKKSVTRKAMFVLTEMHDSYSKFQVLIFQGLILKTTETDVCFNVLGY